MNNEYENRPPDETAVSFSEALEERYELASLRLREIPGETLVPAPYRDYFVRCAGFLLTALKGRGAGNEELYRDILPENYAVSYGNPAFAKQELGDEAGPCLSAVYAELRGIIPCVFENNLKGTTTLLELFLQVYGAFSQGEIPKPSVIREIFGSYLTDYLADHTEERIVSQIDPSACFARSLIEKADFSDPTYLEDFGEYISEETRKTAAFINSLPASEIEAMARTFTEGYRTGFIKAGKPLHKKKTVEIRFELGFERIVKAAVEQFREIGLEATLPRAAYRLTDKRQALRIGYSGAVPNRQFDYDHRNDIALILDKNYVSKRLRILQTAYEDRKETAAEYAGPACLETFGDEPFVPEAKEEALKLSPAQQKLSVELLGESSQIINRYIKGEERSFTIMALPVPSIGEPYGKIFDETIRINTLPSDEYEKIQQRLIDALDKGTHVRILGRGGNETDLMVRLHSLKDPKRETNFENCVADVNIPVGEVFTSPQLTGTNGCLHVTGVYLEGLFFKDLRIEVRDGLISSYSCGNYEDEAEGKAFIKENILFQHETLPMGEFAIGTNTTAYAAGRLYGIEGKFPILIAEKTGPHFAFGDTCYSHEEDVAVFNPDGKEIIARENEKSRLRKSCPSEAYFNCHTDITIPFDELGSIEVLGGGEDLKLIENGRFVLPGTEALNGPLDTL